MDKSKLQLFLIELVKRFATKSPKFFKIFQYVGIAATVMGFIPDALVMLGITPNAIFSNYIEIGLRVAGIVTVVMASLPVPNSSDTNTASILPFTSTTNGTSSNV